MINNCGVPYLPPTVSSYPLPNAHGHFHFQPLYLLVKQVCFSSLPKSKANVVLGFHHSQNHPGHGFHG